MPFGLMKVVIEDSPVSMQGLPHVPAERGQGGEGTGQREGPPCSPTKEVKSKERKEERAWGLALQ